MKIKDLKTTRDYKEKIKEYETIRDKCFTLEAKIVMNEMVISLSKKKEKLPQRDLELGRLGQQAAELQSNFGARQAQAQQDYYGGARNELKFFWEPPSCF